MLFNVVADQVVKLKDYLLYPQPQLPLQKPIKKASKDESLNGVLYVYCSLGLFWVYFYWVESMMTS